MCWKMSKFMLRAVATQCHFLTGLMRFFEKFNLPSFVFFSVWSAILVYRALLNRKNDYIFAKVLCVADKFFIESSA